MSGAKEEPRTAAAIESWRAGIATMIERVDQALQQMRREHATITPASAARRAGVSRSFQYLDTRIVAATVPVEDIDSIRRASIDGYTLTIDHTGAAVLSVPAGRKVTVLTTAA